MSGRGKLHIDSDCEMLVISKKEPIVNIFYNIVAISNWKTMHLICGMMLACIELKRHRQSNRDSRWNEPE